MNLVEQRQAFHHAAGSAYPKQKPCFLSPTHFYTAHPTFWWCIWTTPCCKGLVCQMERHRQVPCFCWPALIPQTEEARAWLLRSITDFPCQNMIYSTRNSYTNFHKYPQMPRTSNSTSRREGKGGRGCRGLWAMRQLWTWAAQWRPQLRTLKLNLTNREWFVLC